MWPDQVLVGPVHSANERRRDHSLSCTHENRLCPECSVATASIRTFARTSVRQKGYPLSVDRDIDILKTFVTAARERHSELVHTVGRKNVIRDHSTTCPIRRSLNMVPRVL